MLKSVIVVCCGASCGALLRWGLAIMLNVLTPSLPLGTLLVNVVGGYLMGVAVSFFSGVPNPDPSWRLFIMTGFLGGLTTFSTFSAEIGALIRQGALGVAFLGITLHLAGSLAAFFLGIWTFNLVRQQF